jgi:hypothetical protein
MPIGSLACAMPTEGDLAIGVADEPLSSPGRLDPAFGAVCRDTTALHGVP